MALLWLEGFEDYGTATDLDLDNYIIRRYGVESGGYFRLIPGRVDGYGLYNRGGSGVTTGYFITPPLTTDDTLIVGLAVRFSGSFPSSSNHSIIRLFDGDTTGIDLRTHWPSGLSVHRGSTLLGMASDLEMTGDVWYFIEIKVKCHDTAGTVEVRVGGATKLALSDVDTKNSSNAYHDRVGVYLDTNIDDVDDIYVCDGSGGANNDFLGNRKVVGLFPNGDSGTVEWTLSEGSTHSTLVDEPLEDDDAEYVESDTSGQTDLYEYQDISGVEDIAGIQVNTICRETDANSFSLITPVKSGSTTSEDSAQGIGTIDYINKRRILDTNPDTGSAWTVNGLNAAQVGVKVG